MKMITNRYLVYITTTLLFTMFYNCSQSIEKNQEYFGQKPPGMEPELFAPEIVSGDLPEHGSVAISPTGKEIYWSRMSSDFQKGTIWYSEWKNNKWMDPQIATFSDETMRDLCPVFSEDGLTLYFTSMRPVNDAKGYNLWRTKIESDKWQEPVPLDTVINHGRESGCSIDKDETIYYMAWLEGDYMSCDIYSAKFENGNYLQPKLIEGGVNSNKIETTPFISPDGGYLLFSSKREKMGYGEFDLYVSFIKDDHTWSDAVNLSAKINSDKNEWFPSVSPDGKYIFFVSDKSGNDDVYWVDASILNQLKIETLVEASLENVPNRKGPYLGEKPPATEPVLFASKFVSGNFMEHSPVIFTNDGNEIYWSPDFRDFDLQGAAIFTMKQENNLWSNPKIADFSQCFCDYNPVLSYDNSMMFFTSNRAYLNQEPELRDLDIWMIQRSKQGWTDPLKVEIENRPGYLMTQFSLTKNNVLYFSSTEDLDKYAWDIYRAEYKSGRFVNTTKLDSSINTAQWETYPFIAQDESYLIFTSMNRPDGFGSLDLYISFHNENGSWTIPKNMGKKINTKFIEAFAGLSPDGRFLFFTSNRGGNVDMYWVNSDIISTLKKNLK